MFITRKQWRDLARARPGRSPMHDSASPCPKGEAARSPWLPHTAFPSSMPTSWHENDGSRQMMETRRLPRTPSALNSSRGLHDCQWDMNGIWFTTSDGASWLDGRVRHNKSGESDNKKCQASRVAARRTAYDEIESHTLGPR